MKTGAIFMTAISLICKDWSDKSKNAAPTVFPPAIIRSATIQLLYLFRAVAGQTRLFQLFRYLITDRFW
ncbi:MAG: hypothetical protein DRH56_04195 [Deltaproteobacteria bacterium]|nr:MAG: hypothetical protein DRH56_04195 [Deltaproteobacteria bacterium]